MTKVFGVLCSNGFCKFDSYTTTKNIEIMRNLYDHIGNTMNKISKRLFNKKYEDLTFTQTREVHKVMLKEL